MKKRRLSEKLKEDLLRLFFIALFAIIFSFICFIFAEKEGRRNKAEIILKERGYGN